MKRNLLREFGFKEGEGMEVPLQKYKLIVSIFGMHVHEDGEVEIDMEYDVNLAKSEGYSEEEIQQELEEVLVTAMEKYHEVE